MKFILFHKTERSLKSQVNSIFFDIITPKEQMSYKIVTILKDKIFVGLLVFISLLLAIQLLIGFVVIHSSTLKRISDTLNNYVSRVQSDISYVDGKWDTLKYLSDPMTPHPNGSSGYLNPLYIVTTEGFVIERNLPINGLLDSSDFKHLAEFNEPQFIQAITNEKWRVLSKVIGKDGKMLGVIFVSYYNPPEANIFEVDKTLQKNINNIESKIEYKNEDIIISSLDIRSIGYDVSFEVVTTFNKVLLNNGRTPSFIDSSYIFDEFKRGQRIIKDTINQEPFLVQSHPVLDQLASPRAVIVSAISLKELYSVLKNYFILSVLFDILSFLPLTFLSYLIIKPALHNYFTEIRSRKVLPKKILFNKKASDLSLDDRKIEIPYASNQYYFCEALFTHPKKRWEQDELLERLGENLGTKNFRKLYDTALAINKKVGFKLIEYKDKTFFVNPQFSSYIS
jgi:hypothetical protein